MLKFVEKQHLMYNIQQHILEIEELGAFLLKLEDVVAQAQSTALKCLRHTRTKYSKNTYYLLDIRTFL